MAATPCPRQRSAVSPYATLLSFTRYVGQTGPGKASYVCGLRRRRETKSGFNPHSRLVKALKEDIEYRCGGNHLLTVTATANPRWRPLYEALTAGALAYLAEFTHAPEATLVRTHQTTTSMGDLTIKINPHFGLDWGDGKQEAIRLHFDQAPPSSEAATATLFLMRSHMVDILPTAQPVLVDVRRGVAIRQDSPAKTQDVERWLAGEAAAFSAMWHASAP